MTQTNDLLDAAIAETDSDRLFAQQLAVCRAAEAAIRTRMHVGCQQGYDPDSWKAESLQRHVLKAVRHAVTALEIHNGEFADDSEDHLSAATCRISMALAIHTSERKKTSPC